nr:reverse transcriptase domain-containing protein [Tanacetum cinerariifolium]
FRFEATNNEAEYEALIAGLRIAEEMGVKNLQENMDSRLLANQVNGTYIAKEADMIRSLEKVRTLTNGFRTFSIKQVPISENKKADALSKISSTSFAHLSKQVLVEELKEKSIKKLEVLAVVEEEGNTWMTLINESYIKETLLVEVNKARVILLAYYAQGCNGTDKGMLRLPGSQTYPKKSTAKVDPNHIPMAILQVRNRQSRTLPGGPPHINHHCCYECGDPLDGIFFHQCTCESCGKGAHYGYNCPKKVLIIPNPEPFNNQTTDELPQTLPSFDPTCYSGDESPFTCDSTPNIVDYSPNVFNPTSATPEQLPVIDQTPLEESMKNLRIAFQTWSENIQQKKEEEDKQITEEQAAKAQYWKIPICYDDGDYTITIIPNEPDNSLSMGEENLDTIPATESDEFIKSSVENLVPNPSESEGEHECDVPTCEDFTTFSNLLFDFDDDFSSCDDQSFSDEDVPKKIYSNPLFEKEIISMKIDPHHFNDESNLIKSLLNHDSSIISSFSKIDSLLDEFARELTLLK